MRNGSASTRFLLIAMAVVAAPCLAEAEVSGDCPVLADANLRIQARAEFLLTESNHLVMHAAPPDSALPNFYVALANVVATRAKEEARIWLVKKIADDLCDKTQGRAAFFPNLCHAIDVTQGYPGTSYAVIKARLREDIFALPACYLYESRGRPGEPHRIFDFPKPKDDAAIDPYVFEAALIAVYVKSIQGTPPEGAPALGGQLPDTEKLARLLVAAAYRRFTSGSATYAVAVNDSAACQPTATQIEGIVAAIKGFLDSNTASEKRVETILVALRDNTKSWCVKASEALEAVGDVYASAVRGDYYEAGFAAASYLFCKNDPQAHNADKICKRLPLLAEVASAKTQEDMEAALDRVIAPLGAWKRKQSEGVFSLNAMAGVAYGNEKLDDTASTGTHSTYGLYVPIALERSWAVSWDKIGIRSVAVGASILDLGSLVSVSEKDEVEGGETSTSANADWSSLAAPGAYVAFAIKDSPLRVGLSYSKTPELRSIDFGGGVKRDVDSTRVMLFVTVDVTLLAF
jgi:hypothetical protein